MNIEQPELKLVRAAYECTMVMTEKMTDIDDTNGIVAVAVPDELRNQFKQKFELYAKYDECFKIIHNYILKHLTAITSKDSIMINIPVSLHPLLDARADDKWNFDSRLEVFEYLRDFVEKKYDKPTLLAELSNKCGQIVNSVILVDADSDEGYTVWVEIYLNNLERYNGN